VLGQQTTVVGIMSFRSVLEEIRENEGAVNPGTIFIKGIGEEEG